jgi:hypothetical protein
MSAIKYIAILWFCCVSCSLSAINWQNDPILTISSKTHDQSLIAKFLQETFESLGPTSQRNLYIQRERTCIVKTSIRYYLRNLEETNQEYEGSECRTNANQKFKSVLKARSNIHELVHGHKDQTSLQLENILIQQFEHRQNLKDYSFYQFDDLDYNLECLLGYQDLMQVKLNETAIEATFERVIDVPDSCEFQQLFRDFSGQKRDQVAIKIPLHGNLYCRKGKTSTCTRTMAETRNSRFKLFFDS